MLCRSQWEHVLGRSPTALTPGSWRRISLEACLVEINVGTQDAESSAKCQEKKRKRKELKTGTGRGGATWHRFVCQIRTPPPHFLPFSTDFERIKLIPSKKSHKTYMINKTYDNIVSIWTTQSLRCIIVPTAETQPPRNQWVRGVKTSSPSKVAK